MMFKSTHLIVSSLSSFPTIFCGSLFQPLWSYWGSPIIPASDLCTCLCAWGHFPQIFFLLFQLSSSTLGIYSNSNFSVRHFLITLFNMWLTSNSWHILFLFPALFFPCHPSLSDILILFHLFILFIGYLSPLDFKFHEGKKFWFIVQCRAWYTVTLNIYWIDE